MENNTDVEKAAARRLAQINAEIKDLQEEAEQYKSYFKDPDRFRPGTYDYDGIEIVVSTNRRISDKKAKELLTRIDYEQISSLKVDTRKAKLFLRESELETIMDTYDHRIEVRIK